MLATDTLRTEHRLIERVLDALEVAAARLDAGEDAPAEALEKALEFVRGFADACHHAKEEQHLFPAFRAKGMLENGGPLGMMLREHELGRGHVRAMAEALPAYRNGDVAAKQRFADNARSYVELLRQHIWKEDNVVFPSEDMMFTEPERARLSDAFEEVERQQLGGVSHDHYHAIVEELETIFSQGGMTHAQHA